jgi:peptide/nickel transport system ATP-binding protein
LLKSRLIIDPDTRIEIPPLVGDPPNPINPPSGCRFRTRCPYAEAICAERAPSLGNATYARDEHLAACHITNPIAGHSMAGQKLQALHGEEIVKRATEAH